MNVKVILAAAIAMSLSVPAMSADDKGGDQKDQPAAAPEKKICRTETVTGSLISKRRICMTKTEWDKLALDTKHDIDKYTSRGSGIPGTPSNSLSPQ